MNIFQYLQSDWRNILDLTLQHLELVGIAVSLAIVIGVPLGILIVRVRWLAGPLMGLATIVLTLPSIALFGLMIPVFSRFGAGIGPCRPSPPCSCIRCCRSCATPTWRWKTSKPASRKPASASA
jgi:ABC-type proline/glycine betaine transport system permease subunit